jgi:hypothetical protein
MRVAYTPAVAGAPIPTLAGTFFRYRPLLGVRLTGPADTWICDGLLDTGADDTVFEESLAVLLGIDLSQAERRTLGIVGRPQPVVCRYAPVELRITDGAQETYTWSAVVGFVSARLRYPLLGHAGFLQFFDVRFEGGVREVELFPNATFPGARP